MKKFICAILTAALLLTTMVPALAATVQVPETTIASAMQAFSDNMPENPHQRIKIWQTFKAYMLDGNNGIDTIIRALKGETTLPESSDMQKIFNQFVDSVKDQYADEFIFFLQLYRGTPYAERKISLNNFGLEGATTAEEIEKTPLPLTSAQATAAANLFNPYVTADGHEKLEEHDIDVANFLNLLTPFNGLFQMTDTREGDFVLSSYSKEYAESLAETMDYEGVNGVAVSGDTNVEKGYDILCGVVAMFNGFTAEQKADLKIVLAHDDINLYNSEGTAAEDPADTEEDEEEDEDEGGSGSGSGGGLGGGSRLPFPSSKDEFTLKDPTYDKTSPLFIDIAAGSWETPYVMNLTGRKIFVGYEDGSFRPNIGITRQEIAVAMVRAIGQDANAQMAANANTGFADDASIADWSRGYVNMAVTMGLFTGYEDGEFKPNRTISRQELMAVVMRLIESKVDADTTMNYTDADDIHGYAKAYIAKATNLDIVGGYPDGTFLPLKDITRAEAAKILYNAFEYYNYYFAR